MADTNVRILVSALDNASNVLKKIGKAMEDSIGKQAQKNATDLTTASAGLAGGIDLLAGSFGKVALTAASFLGIITAIVGTLGFLVKAIQIAGRAETMGVVMNAVARATGNSTAALKEHEAQLKRQGIATIEAREILTRFMQSQLDVADASRIARVAQDLAVIADQNSSETATDLTEAIASQNVIMLRKYGIVTTTTRVLEDYGDQVGKTADRLTQQEQRQAFVNLILEEGQKITGAYEDSMETFAKKVGSLDRAFQEAAIAIGSAFLPVAKVLVDTLYAFLLAIPDSALITAPFKLLGIVLYSVIALFQQLGTLMGAVFGGIVGTIKFGITNGVETFKKGLNDMYLLAVKQQTNITDIWTGETQKQTNALLEALRKQEEGHKGYGVKVQKKLNDETDAYLKALQKRNAAFEESLSDMIHAHIDKKDNLIQDIADENSAFKESMEERIKDFKEKMDEMVFNHVEKVADIKQSQSEEDESFTESMNERVRDFNEKMNEMVAKYEEKVIDIKQSQAEENKSFLESMQERTDKFNETMENMATRHEEKVRKLQRYMDRERKVGDEANNVRFLDLKQELEDENTEYSKSVAKKEASQAKEIAKEQAQHDEKLTKLAQKLTDEEALYTKNRLKTIANEEEQTEKLQKEHDKRLARLTQRLVDEDALYTKNRLKTISDEEEQTEKLQVEHDKRINATQKELNEEIVILKRHQTEVDSEKDKAVEDDIARLKRHHTRENGEALEQHNKKILDIKYQGMVEGAEHGIAIIEGISPELKKLDTMMSESGKLMADNFATSISSGARKAGEGLIVNFLQGIIDKTQEFTKKTRTLGGIIASIFGPIGGIAWQLFGKQTGGVIPGPIGQPIPILAHGGEYVTPQGITPRGMGRGGGNITFNVSIGLYAGSETEKRNIAKKLYTSLLDVAQSQHRSVSELMGG